MWLIVPSAGRLPARHRGNRDTALDCAFRRPRRLQPTTLPVAAPWMAAPYHAVTRASRAIFLAIPLPPLARRLLLPPVTTRFALIRTRNAGRAVTGGMRAGPRLSPRRRSNARSASRRPRAFAGGRPLRAIGGGAGEPTMRTPGSVRTREADRTGDAWHRCARNPRSCRRWGPRRASLGGAQTPAGVPPAQPTPTPPGGASGRRRNEDSPVSFRSPRRRARLLSGGVRECESVMVVPRDGESGVPRAPAPSGRAAERGMHGTRTGWGSAGAPDGRGAPSVPVPCGERRARCGAVRTASHGVFRRVRNSGTNAEGWHGDSGRARAPDSPSETWEMVMTGRLLRQAKPWRGG